MMERLLRRYGDRVEESLISLVAVRPELAPPSSMAVPGTSRRRSFTRARTRGALQLEDVLERRTRLAITTRDRGERAAPDAAGLMAGVLGWGAEHTDLVVQAWSRRVAAERAGEAQGDDESALAAYEAALAGGRALVDTGR